MTESGRPRPLKRILIEGVVIVASILMAFAIDAWWGDLGEQREEERILEAVLAELQELSRDADGTFSYQKARARIVLELLDQVGPNPQLADGERVWAQIDSITSTGPLLLATGAIDGLFESGRVVVLDDLELRDRLARWRGTRSFFESLSDFTADYTDRLNSYLVDQGIGGALPRLRMAEESRFSHDPTRLLSDPVFESHLIYLHAVIRVYEDTEASMRDELDDLIERVERLTGGG